MDVQSLPHPRDVVSRDALIDAVWGSAHVSDASVTEAIKQLRRVLGDAPDDPKHIQTIQRRGYRLISPVTEDTFDPLAAASGPRTTSWLWDPRLWMATTALLALVLVFVLLAR